MFVSLAIRRSLEPVDGCNEWDEFDVKDFAVRVMAAQWALPRLYFKGKDHRLRAMSRTVNLGHTSNLCDQRDLRARFFPYFADQRICDQLASFHEPAGQDPVRLGAIGALLLDKHYAIPVTEDRDGNMVNCCAVRRMVHGLSFGSRAISQLLVRDRKITRSPKSHRCIQRQRGHIVGVEANDGPPHAGGLHAPQPFGHHRFAQALALKIRMGGHRLRTNPRTFTGSNQIVQADAPRPSGERTNRSRLPA